jgi:hypothetical protein
MPTTKAGLLFLGLPPRANVSWIKTKNVHKMSRTRIREKLDGKNAPEKGKNHPFLVTFATYFLKRYGRFIRKIRKKPRIHRSIPR